jgi:hypothetical protein
VRTVFADVNRDTVTAAIKASARPELAMPWVGDLADPAARNALLTEAANVLGCVTHFVHSASPPRREADHAMASPPKPGRGCMRSISRPDSTSRANWRGS